ncbi:hypothetical protein DVH05_015208 [Phytophthora capsici]|nr:hypothetical protein DVH05_015208 [Phytophthora capsici]|eukprot:jgi/Phyca11/116702/e_gw1.31.101.1
MQDPNDFPHVSGFRPIVLYDTRTDLIDESLTLSRSRKEQLPHFSTLSSRELDEIDAECVLSPESQDKTSPPQHRERGFAVEDPMFNYRAFGSIRNGLAPIALLNRRHAGLALSALASGATVAIIRTAYRPLLLSVLKLQFQKSYDTQVTLLDWSGLFSVFLGLLPDCVPIYGTRRKSYIALGWIFCAVSFGCISGIYTLQIQDVEDPRAMLGRLLEAWSVVGSFALQLVWVSMLALVVGFGQREALSERGGLAMLCLVLWQTGVLVAHLVVAEFQQSLTLANTSAAIATISVIILPFVFWFLHDDDEQEATATLISSTKRVGLIPALRTGVIQVWEICQEKVTYRVVMFLLMYGSLLKAYDPDVNKALAGWSGFASSDNGDNPWVLVIQSSLELVALIHAKWRLLGVAWRQLAYIGTGIVVIGTIIQVTIISMGIIRTKWFFSMFLGIIIWPKTWIVVFMVLTTTEVAHVGCEAVTMGLVLSGLGLGTSALNVIEEWIKQSTNSTNIQEMADEDSPSTRVHILFFAVAYVAVNLFAAVTVLWLPRSKLEAQQLRAFGGYSWKGAALIMVLFFVLLALVIVANLQVI